MAYSEWVTVRTVSVFERDLVAAYVAAVQDRDVAAMPVCPACGDPLDCVVTTTGEIKRIVHPMPCCPEFVQFMENAED